MELKTLIIEDEANSREILRNYLAKYCPNTELMGAAANITDGLALIHAHIDELIKAVEYVREVKQKENALEGRVLATQTPKTEGKITLPQQDGFQVLQVDDIYFCKADDNYTEIYLEHKRIVVSKTLKYFEEALIPYAFARIHKSFLVNIAKVVKYKKGKGGSVVLSNTKELTVSASRKAEL